MIISAEEFFGGACVLSGFTRSFMMLTRKKIIVGFQQLGGRPGGFILAVKNYLPRSLPVLASHSSLCPSPQPQKNNFL